MDSRPKFATFIAELYLRPEIKRRWLVGPKFICFDGLLERGYPLFSHGAMLGRAFRDRFDIFAVPYMTQPDSPEAVESLRGQGASVALVEQYTDTAYELFILHEMSLDDPTQEPDTWPQWLMTHAQARLPAQTGVMMGVMFGARGAAFGSQFPARFEELYMNQYNTCAKIDPADYERAREAGLDIPPTLDEALIPTLDEAQQGYVSDFAEFCAKFYPEYLAALGLGGYAK